MGRCKPVLLYTFLFVCSYIFLASGEYEKYQAMVSEMELQVQEFLESRFSERNPTEQTKKERETQSSTRSKKDLSVKHKQNFGATLGAAVVKVADAVLDVLNTVAPGVSFFVRDAMKDFTSGIFSTFSEESKSTRNEL